MCKTSSFVFFVAAGLTALPVVAEETVARSANALAVPPQMAVLAETPQFGQADDKALAYRDESASSSEIPIARPDATRKPIDAPGGLHWANDGQRPVLQYPLTGGTVMRIRGAGGGAAMSFNWKF